MWNRFWSLETAGLLAAAGIIAAILYPFLKPDETGQWFTPESRSESPLPAVAEGTVEDPGPETKDRLAEKQALPRQAVTEDDRQNTPLATTALRLAEPPADPTAEENESREDSRTSFDDDFIEGLPVIGQENVDDLIFSQDTQSAPEEKEKVEALGESTLAAAPSSPETDGRAAKKSASQSVERILESADRAAGPAKSMAATAPSASFAGDTAELVEQVAGAAIPFRVVPFPGAMDLGDKGFRALKTEVDLAPMRQADSIERLPATDLYRVIPKNDLQKAAALGIAPEKEMGILLASRREGDPPVRIDVVEVRQTAAGIYLRFRETPIPREEESYPRTTAYQVVIISASDLEIYLQKID